MRRPVLHPLPINLIESPIGTVARISMDSGKVGPWTMLPGWMVTVFMLAKKPRWIVAGVTGYILNGRLPLAILSGTRTPSPCEHPELGFLKERFRHRATFGGHAKDTVRETPILPVRKPACKQSRDSNYYLGP